MNPHTVAASAPALDQLTGATASVVFSTRKMRAAYAGNCMRIRRSSDSAQQDIGFNATGLLDTAAIVAFIGGGTGFVVTWYDQSGNGYNVTQATASNQPKIAVSGAVITVNSKPAILPSFAANTWLGSNAAPSASIFQGGGTDGEISIIAIPSRSATGSSAFGWQKFDVIELGRISAHINYTDENECYWDPGDPTDTRCHFNNSAQTGLLGIYNLVMSASGGFIVVNGTTKATAANPSEGIVTSSFGIFSASHNGGFAQDTEMCEFIAFHNKLSNGDRNVLKANQAAHYAISGVL